MDAMVQEIRENSVNSLYGPILQVPADSLCRVTYIFHLSRRL